MRPFYFEYAHLYDLISGKESVDRMLGLRNLLGGYDLSCKILDAGCGTGNYTQFLNDLGFDCLGLDLSDKLLDVAKNKFPEILFKHGNLLDLNFVEDFDIVLCRGVLNDVDYLDFILILKNFYRALKQNGVLLLDVREWNNSLVKYTQTPVFSKEFIYQHSACKFTSLTTVNNLDNSLDIKEEHLIAGKSTKYNFKMYPKCLDDLKISVGKIGFSVENILSAYDYQTQFTNQDKMLLVLKKH